MHLRQQIEPYQRLGGGGDIGYAHEKQRGDDMDVQTIENEALRLPPEDRANLAQKLLLSLDTLSEEEVEQAWIIEAGRRARELDRGDVQPISADEMQRRARALLR